ncbi:hypothetical protein EBZ38_11535 [bacterium]|nr:hypothetical protein [bacterium]
MKIAYNDSEGLKILTPVIDIDIKIIADKDVPSGLYYKIISPLDLPSREFRSAWELEINESNADGIGLTKEEFDEKYPDYKGMAVQ